MNPDRWKRLIELYPQALEQPESERETWIRAQCADDAELLGELRRLLASRPSQGFIEPPTPGALAPLPPEVQVRSLGDFELLSEIGRGGMGVVFRAWQRSVGRMVAVKVLPPSLALSAQKVERFEREARAVGKLRHPGIAAVYSVGVDQGMHYFAMELVDGHNLAVELESLRARQRGPTTTVGVLPDTRAQGYLRTVARIVRDAADALQFAHANGIVHRDVKPANLLYDSAGRVRIVDFGLARDEALGTITRSGELAGTPHYMSPEQARAKRGAVDHRTDVYSLGVVLFELLTLKRPFDGRSSHEIVSAILFKDPPRVRALNVRVPRDLELICQMAMAKDLRERYADAAALRDDLDRFLSHESIVAHAPRVWTRAWRWARRHRTAVVASAAALLALLGGSVWVRAQERARQIDNLESALREARGDPSREPIADVNLTRLVSLRQTLAALERERAAPSRQSQAIRLELDGLRAEWLETGRTQIEAARAPTLSESAAESQRLNGVQTLLMAGFLFPEDEQIAALARLETALPQLSIDARDTRGAAIDAQVSLRQIDVATSGLGPPRRLGPANGASFAVLPGYYRVVVEFEAGGFRELITSLGSGNMHVRLVATRRDDEERVTDGMIAFDAGEFTFKNFPKDYEAEGAFQGRTLHLDAFLVDATEVSNREFARFCEATGRAEPTWWSTIEDRRAFFDRQGDLPVAFVNWDEAVAYAEWAGKRLMTLAEWHRAVGGLEGREYPWGAQPAGAAARGNVNQPAFAYPRIAGGTPEAHQRAYLDAYLAAAANVRSFPEANTPEGLFHCWGNVMEFTESMAVWRSEGDKELVFDRHQRIVTGAAWDAVATNRSPYLLRFDGVGERYRFPYIGFRCAKAREAAP